MTEDIRGKLAEDVDLTNSETTRWPASAVLMGRSKGACVYDLQYTLTGGPPYDLAAMTFPLSRL